MKVAPFALVFAAGAALAASSAMAGTPRAVVRYDDLRLTTAEGQAALQKRLDKAAWHVCKFDENGMVRTGEEHGACYRASRQEAAVRMAQVMATQQLGG